jgi:hypothetical protein
VLVETRSRSATSFTFNMELTMKPYLAEYLRSRDLDRYDCLLRELTRSSSNPCKRIVRSTVEILMPIMLRDAWFPSLSEAEMRRIAYDLVTGLDIPEEWPPTWVPKPEDYENDDA